MADDLTRRCLQFILGWMLHKCVFGDAGREHIPTVERLLSELAADPDVTTGTPRSSDPQRSQEAAEWAARQADRESAWVEGD